MVHVEDMYAHMAMAPLMGMMWKSLTWFPKSTTPRYETCVTHGKIMAKKLMPSRSLKIHVGEMIALFNRMDILGRPFDDVLAYDTILYSLHGGYDIVKLNHDDEDSTTKLLDLLVNHSKEELKKGES